MHIFLGRDINTYKLTIPVLGGKLNAPGLEFRVNGDDRKARIQDYNRDRFNRIDAGTEGGFGYTLLKGTGISIGVYYYNGLVNVSKETIGSGNNYSKFNNSIML